MLGYKQFPKFINFCDIFVNFTIEKIALPQDPILRVLRVQAVWISLTPTMYLVLSKTNVKPNSDRTGGIYSSHFHQNFRTGSETHQFLFIFDLGILKSF